MSPIASLQRYPLPLTLPGTSHALATAALASTTTDTMQVRKAIRKKEIRAPTAVFGATCVLEHGCTMHPSPTAIVPPSESESPSVSNSPADRSSTFPPMQTRSSVKRANPNHLANICSQQPKQPQQTDAHDDPFNSDEPLTDPEDTDEYDMGSFSSYQDGESTSDGTEQEGRQRNPRKARKRPMQARSRHTRQQTPIPSPFASTETTSPMPNPGIRTRRTQATDPLLPGLPASPGRPKKKHTEVPAATAVVTTPHPSPPFPAPGVPGSIYSSIASVSKHAEELAVTQTSRPTPPSVAGTMKAPSPSKIAKPDRPVKKQATAKAIAGKKQAQPFRVVPAPMTFKLEPPPKPLLQLPPYFRDPFLTPSVAEIGSSPFEYLLPASLPLPPASPPTTVDSNSNRDAFPPTAQALSSVPSSLISFDPSSSLSASSTTVSHVSPSEATYLHESSSSLEQLLYYSADSLDANLDSVSALNFMPAVENTNPPSPEDLVPPLFGESFTTSGIEEVGEEKNAAYPGMESPPELQE